MIGIVIVSHSAQLARGVLELAREMAGPDVPIAAAGGFNAPGPALGTDVVLVLQAVGQVYSDDGVLVLMDMGSAILSAEMAVEMLPAERGAKVMLCSAPIVEGAVAAATAARLGRTLGEIAKEANNALAVKRAHLESEYESPGPPVPAVPEQPWQCYDGADFQIRVFVRNNYGLHARPAARLIRTAAGFQAEVRVSNVTINRGPVGTRSLNDLMMLGALKGHELHVYARGPQARKALDALKALAERNFGDDEDGRDKSDIEGQTIIRPVDTTAGGPDKYLSGSSVSPGIAIGPAQFLRVPMPTIPFHSASDPKAEWEELVAAWDKTELQIEHQREQVACGADQSTRELFDAHLFLLQDDSLHMSARRQIFDHGHNSARAWHLTVENAAAQYDSLGDAYLAARVADLREVGRRVLFNLLEYAKNPLAISKPGIIVGMDIGLTDIASIDPKLILGICAGHNGLTTHGAILARSLGIPAVMGLGERVLEIEQDSTVIVDGGSGIVWVDPPSGILDDYRERLESLRISEEKIRRESLSPAITRDGRRIEIAANIGSPAEVQTAVANGAEGVGLYRTEFLFLSREAAPGEEEQYSTYLEAARSLKGNTLVIRTLDIGGDKVLPYLALEEERNPFLGLRGLRLSLKHRDLFMTQLRAIVRVAAEFPVKLMFPMVSTLAEWREAMALLSHARAEVVKTGLSLPLGIETGIMVEVPAAALLSGQFAPLVDFFSIGSNDLTQYTMAAERGNPGIQNLADGLHPAVLQLIHHVVEAAHACGKWVSICGEMAGDAAAAPLLVGLGIDKLSMSSHGIPLIKQTIRKLDFPALQCLAKKALLLENAEDVRGLLKELATPL